MRAHREGFAVRRTAFRHGRGAIPAGTGLLPTYGRAVRAFRNADISPTTYAEKMVETPVVEASGTDWTPTGCTTWTQRTGAGQWIALVDALGVLSVRFVRNLLK